MRVPSKNEHGRPIHSVPSGLVLRVVFGAVLLLAYAMSAHAQQRDDSKPTPNIVANQTGLKPAEQSLVERIQKLAMRGTTDFPFEADLQVRTSEQLELLSAADELLKTFPDSSFRDSALIAKMAALAALARTQSAQLDALLYLTDEIAAKSPTGELASENAYYAIQAFVLGARREQMPDDKRRIGSIERYRAFLQDFPTSSRRSVIWASLIRNMIATKKVDDARKELTLMEKEFPHSPAVKRSKGEINRARAIGMPFAISIKTPSGELIRTQQFKGDVVIVHYWASWNPASMEQLSKLSQLNEKFKEQGLRLVGISLDKEREKFDEIVNTHKLSWPQMYDALGSESEIVMASGVVELPLVFVVDRAGISRAVGRGDEIEELVPKLLRELVPPERKPSPESKP